MCSSPVNPANPTRRCVPAMWSPSTSRTRSGRGPSPRALPLDVLYQDSDLIVVNKPSGMVVHPAAGHAAGTLVNASASSRAGPERHRRRTPDQASCIGWIVERRASWSSPSTIALTRSSPGSFMIGKSKRNTSRSSGASCRRAGVSMRRSDATPTTAQKMSARARRARSAVTRITRARYARGVSLIHVAIATGRTHQIRVHLNAIGHPVVGDALVRRSSTAPRGRPAARWRVSIVPFLHAHRLVFHHPTDGRRMEFECPLPADFSSPTSWRPSQSPNNYAARFWELAGDRRLSVARVEIHCQQQALPTRLKRCAALSNPLRRPF